MEVIDLIDSDGDDESLTDSDVAASGRGSNGSIGDAVVASLEKSNGSKPSKSKRGAAQENDDILVIGDEENTQQNPKPESNLSSKRVVKNPYKKQRSNSSASDVNDSNQMLKKENEASSVENPYAKKSKSIAESKKAQLKNPPEQQQRELQAGLVFEEDVDHIQHSLKSNNSSSLKQPFKKKSSTAKPGLSKSGNDNSSEEENENDILTAPHSAQAYAQHQYTTRLAHNLPPILYHDRNFAAGNPQTIDGSAKTKGKSNNDPVSIAPPKCRCRPAKPCKLAYSTKAGPNRDRPYYCCQKGKSGGCNYFSWAFTSHMIHWYRFGIHTGHSLVKSNRGFRAEDLVQGKVGDCWFLSALAVVAERDDLIGRLLSANSNAKNCGVIEVKLFVDGYWKKIIIDDFLPCLIDSKSEKEEEDNIRLALMQSLEYAGIDSSHMATMESSNKKNGKQQKSPSSKFDPSAIADESRNTLSEIHEFLHHDRFSKDPSYRSNGQNSFVSQSSKPLQRRVLTNDLAYSKARHNQLWVPFVEKAYAKIHGSYRAISGGHVEEAFLDLTGAPTAVWNFDHHDFNPRQFWGDLMRFKVNELPMGCGTSSSAAGIIGMHAYSILDVREVRNVGMDFFRDKIATGTLGNVSGFTELDGTVRLLRIRNPHGQGEWKGDFSDKSPIWESLMRNRKSSWKESNGAVDLTVPQVSASPELKRSMANDGVFWIDYDSFLMGFHNVDVVLAFRGNHAKSFSSSFPVKKSNHRCTRAFQVSAVGRQPGEEGTYNGKVEVYVMCIQKTKRGASLGRADRKVSYKQSDIGILVGEQVVGSNDDQIEFRNVDGFCFGIERNGHIKLELDRSDPDKRLIVMPISFGHPSATDEERSFVVRFVANAPLMVQELAEPPKMNVVMNKFCFGGRVMSLGSLGTSRHRGTQGNKTVLMEMRANKSFLFKVLRIDCLAGGGGTVLLYLIVNNQSMSQMKQFLDQDTISFNIEINCRGMVCRTDRGMETHEVISKGKKFEAAWRRFSLTFSRETQSRLLASVVQGGQDYQMGSIKCTQGQESSSTVSGPMSKYIDLQKPPTQSSNDKGRFSNYDEFGLFSSMDTPPNIFEGGCINLAVAKPTHSYAKQTEPINLIDQSSNLEAAIMASLKESQGGGGGTKERIDAPNQSSFSDDIEKAIAMSLKDQ